MNGILIVNKDSGCTSRDVVNLLVKKFNTKKIGHTGTLDPMASGVLIVCIGKALKVSELLLNHDKEYIAEVTLGMETDTLDTDGVILKEEKVDISNERINDVIKSFRKKYFQEVPNYSAVKVNGRKLYDYARGNIKIDLPKRKVDIKEIELVSDIVHIDGKIKFKIRCLVSKGTYIRSLIRDIGVDLGTCATLSMLIRTKVGNYGLDDSYSINDIMNDNYDLISIPKAFDNIPLIKVDDKIAFKVRNGVILNRFFDTDMAFIVDKDNNLLALYKNEYDKCRVYKMF